MNVTKRRRTHFIRGFKSSTATLLHYYTAKILSIYVELFGHIANDEFIVHYLLELYGFLILKLEEKNSILMTNTIM